MKTVGMYEFYPDITKTRRAEGGKRTKGIFPSRTGTPLVTVITVCYNSAKTIEGTFESLRNQTYSNLEYIVIDGGSTDGTVCLLQRNDELIDYYISEPDEGLYHAMNKGLSLAAGDLILMLNSDDWYENDAIERLVGAYLASGCDFVGALARYINADSSSFVLPSMRFDHSTLLRMPLRHQTMLIPADIYNEIGPYDVRLPIIADFDFAIRLYKARKTYFEVPSPLLNFRTTGVSSTALDKLDAEHKALLLRIFPFLSLEQAASISNHAALTPVDLISVARSHPDQTEFLLAIRDMIGDFARVWGGQWSAVEYNSLTKLGVPDLPKISVIIPIYNASNFIDATLLSLVKQDFDSFEVICIDDCSPDDSAERIRRISFYDKRIRLIRLSQNKGPGGARNEGIREAYGEFVFFLDADDSIPSNALSALYEIGCANRSDIVRGAFQIDRNIHGTQVKCIKFPADVSDHAINCTTLSETPALLTTTEGHWACLYNRSFVETILYPEELSMGEDSLFLIRALAQAKTVSTTPKIVYFYQDAEKSALNTYSFKKYMDEVTWRRRAWAILKDTAVSEKGYYFLFDYWDLSLLQKIPERLSTAEALSFFSALREAFACAGAARAEQCSNDSLRNFFEDQFIIHGLLDVVPACRSLTIALLSSSDSGGAGIASQRCMDAMRSLGHGAFSVCLFRQSDRPNVYLAPLEKPASEILNAGGNAKLWDFWSDKVVVTDSSSPRSTARELFSRTDSIVDAYSLGKSIASVDLIHLHWIVGMLDYENIETLLGNKPVVWTLHDMNAFTGGCHYSEGCENYRNDCRACPLLQPGSDLAHKAWETKKKNLAKIRNLHVICPSRWLAECVSKSSLLGDRPTHVIPNFLPVNKFVPTNKVVARLKLGLPLDRTYIAFGADSLANMRKGGHILKKAITHLHETVELAHSEVLLFGAAELEVDIPTRNMGYVSDAERLSLIYAAADVYAFPSLEDNAPQTVVEALLSGTCVVGFPVGNVPDLVTHLKTGYIANYGDPADFANGLRWAISRSRTHEATLRSLHCHSSAYSHHEPSSTLQQHLSLFHSIIATHTN